METTRKRAVQYFLVIVLVSVAIPATLGNAAVSTKGMNGYSALTPKTGGYYENLGTLYSVTTLDNVKIKVLNYHPAGKTLNTGKQPILLIPGIGANMNEFLTQTTKRILDFYTPTLPANLADWAKNDPNIMADITKDPLLYYNIGYYLWSQGYDVWLLNYRGTGYAEAKSAFGDVGKTTLDVFGLYDARAALNLVNTVTKQHPICGGHSTGGTVTMMLLQGCYIKSDGHVATDSNLENIRNGKNNAEGAETIKGFIGLDPAGIPSITKLLDNIIVWTIYSWHTYLDLRGIVEALDGKGKLSLTQLVSGMLMAMGDNVYTRKIVELMNIDTTNTNAMLLYSLILYGADTLYFCYMQEYGDWAKNTVIREHFQNGAGNQNKVTPPTPRAGDGYYYYSKNMWKWTVPAIFICASMQSDVFDLVNNVEIKKDWFGGKTSNSMDQFWIFQGAHIEFSMGFSAPRDIFRTLGPWLASVSA